MPGLRGNRSSHEVICTRRVKRPSGASTTRSTTSPKVSSDLGGQRTGSVCSLSPAALSLTTAKPPTRNNGAATSATTAGRAKQRATTKSTCPRRVDLPASSADSTQTATRSARPHRRSTRRNQSARAADRSTKVQATGSDHTSTRPGTPPPEPRSTTCLIDPRSPAVSNPRYASACAIWTSNGDLPRYPRV